MVFKFCIAAYVLTPPPPSSGAPLRNWKRNHLDLVRVLVDAAVRDFVAVADAVRVRVDAGVLDFVTVTAAVFVAAPLRVLECVPVAV